MYCIQYTHPVKAFCHGECRPVRAALPFPASPGMIVHPRRALSLRRSYSNSIRNIPAPMSDRLFAHLPFAQASRTLDALLGEGVQPEIAFSGPDLERLAPADLAPIARRLSASEKRATVHAPFHDLNPGAIDPLVRAATAKRFSQTLAAADALGASLVVFHPGYEKWKYGLRPQLWLEASLEFWPPFLEIAERQDCLIAVENIFEDEPQTLIDLVAALDSPRLGHCFDIGHWHLFSGRDLEGWIRLQAPRLFHLHLHDNHGDADEHLPVGEGKIPFEEFFSLLGRCGVSPTMTLEAHTPENLRRSLLGIRPFLA